MDHTVLLFQVLRHGTLYQWLCGTWHRASLCSSVGWKLNFLLEYTTIPDILWVCGMWASTRSPITGGSEWHHNDSMLTLFRVCICPKMELSLLNKVRKWSTAYLPVALVTYNIGIILWRDRMWNSWRKKMGAWVRVGYLFLLEDCHYLKYACIIYVWLVM